LVEAHARARLYPHEAEGMGNVLGAIGDELNAVCPEVLKEIEENLK
jgi:hypothetical protein